MSYSIINHRVARRNLSEMTREESLVLRQRGGP